MRKVTAADANRQFSALMREAEAGETIVVTSHGRSVVKIVSVDADDAEKVADRKAAHKRLMERLHSQPRRPAVKWTRDELYEDEPYPDTFK